MPNYHSTRERRSRLGHGVRLFHRVHGMAATAAVVPARIHAGLHLPTGAADTPFYEN